MTGPAISDLVRVFARIGVLSFGGPAAQIALMHRELVDRRDWLSEKEFLSALSFCMLLPGPEAMQLATYSGWKLHGVRGGLIAGGLFVLPGALVVLGLAIAYAAFGQVSLVEAMFLGIQATVVVIVLEALHRISHRALKRRAHWVIAALSFVAIFALGLPFPAIIAAAALWGAITTAGPTGTTSLPLGRGTLRTIATWGALWLTPIVALWAAGATLLTEIAIFFSKLAVVTFGGAYAVLAYMTQEVVQDRGWLTTPQMVDGLGLAETTPGPLILVTEFVGYLAGHGAGGILLGVSAAMVALWVTFVPCFLWIFAGAPYLDWIGGRPRLSAALSAITASVVGVILNLSLWFAAHVFFGSVETFSVGPLTLIAPDWSTLDLIACALAAVAAGLLFGARLPLPAVIAASAMFGIVAETLT